MNTFPVFLNLDPQWLTPYPTVEKKGEAILERLNTIFSKTIGQQLALTAMNYVLTSIPEDVLGHPPTMQLILRSPRCPSDFFKKVAYELRNQPLFLARLIHVGAWRREYLDSIEPDLKDGRKLLEAVNTWNTAYPQSQSYFKLLFALPQTVLETQAGTLICKLAIKQKESPLPIIPYEWRGNPNFWQLYFTQLTEEMAQYQEGSPQHLELAAQKADCLFCLQMYSLPYIPTPPSAFSADGMQPSETILLTPLLIG